MRRRPPDRGEARDAVARLIEARRARLSELATLGRVTRDAADLELARLGAGLDLIEHAPPSEARAYGPLVESVVAHMLGKVFAEDGRVRVHLGFSVGRDAIHVKLPTPGSAPRGLRHSVEDTVARLRQAYALLKRAEAVCAEFEGGEADDATGALIDLDDDEAA